MRQTVRHGDMYSGFLKLFLDAIGSIALVAFGSIYYDQDCILY